MSKEAMTITRRSGENEFEKLRSQMLEHVQRLSSDVWTDYNLHDPGVTILEQLSYALTDINYRSGYPVDEVLANDQQHVALHHHGLFNSQEAFSCSPVNRIDLAKYILDRIPEIAHIHIDIVSRSVADVSQHVRLPWLIEIGVKTKEMLTNQSQRLKLRKKIFDHFHRVRCLGEDLYAIKFSEDRRCKLAGCVVIREGYQAVEVLSEFYRCAQHYLLGQLNNDNNNYQHDPYKRYLDGPRLKRQYIDDDALRRTHRNLTTNDLVDQLKEIDGVEDIVGLTINLQSRQPRKNKTTDDEVSDSANPYLEARHEALRLDIPQRSETNLLTVVQNGRELQIDLEVLSQSIQFSKDQRAQRFQTTSIAREKVAFDSTARAISSYSSVMSQFPNNYGINQFGVPRHESDLRKAQSKQLRGYLVLFDQVMADHLAMVDNIKELFSLEIENQSSYPTKVLTTAHVPGLNDIYEREPTDKFLQDSFLQQDHDHRKARIFDYLRSINGQDKEKFGFELSNPYFSHWENRKRLLYSKSRAVEKVHEYSENRFCGYDYTQKSWGNDNISTLERRILLNLGLSERRQSTVYPLVKYGFTFAKGKLGFHFNSNENNPDRELANIFYQDLMRQNIEFDDANLISVPLVKVTKNSSRRTFNHIKNISFANLDNIQEILFSCGADIENFKLEQSKNKNSIRLYLNIVGSRSHQNRWLYLASFKSFSQAVKTANEISFCIKELNLAMEGLHLIEHTLLLPVDRNFRIQLHNQSDYEFYRSRISILLPCWTARFSDINFQKHVSEMIWRECPAHICPTVRWLDYSLMEEFEVLFKNWADEKAELSNHLRLNKLSERIRLLLLRLDAEQKSTSVTGDE